LDTNVIVSGLMGEGSVPAQAAAQIIGGRCDWLVDSRIVDEYRCVLRRPEFRFNATSVDYILFRATVFASQVLAYPLDLKFPDPSDRPFVEVAVAGGAEAIVTGNVKDFQATGGALDIAIVTPRQFLDLLARR
jgi:putative PIN family toxin of toxin-antitoxin system